MNCNITIPKEGKILGLGGSSHDFSAALMIDSDIRIAIEEERLTRKKHGTAWWYQNPLKNSIRYCLDSQNLSIEDISTIVSSDLLPQRALSTFDPTKIILYPHHLCHVGSALIFAPQNARIGIIVCDGMGSIRKINNHITHRETISFYIYADKQLTCLGENTGVSLIENTDFPMGCSNSIGHLYEIVTMSLGFGEFEEGKTMGLAAHGKPQFLPMLQNFVKFGHSMNKCFLSDPIKNDFGYAIESVLRNGGYSFSIRADMAASMQALLEQTVQHCLNLFTANDLDMFAISGGCGLNSVANGNLALKLKKSMPLLIPPVPGDAGLGLGALWLWVNQQNNNSSNSITFKKNKITSLLAKPGKTYSNEDIKEAIKWAYPKVAVDTQIKGAKELANLIVSGKILGVFQEGSEIGPRALGRRSIMADCRSAAIREHVNRSIKQREPFRPLAPIILRSRFNDFFVDPRQADEYMIKVAGVRQDKICKIPAVVHIDGTARVQVVDEKTDAFITTLLKEIDRLTGIPMVINTSFNRRGEPIVETPIDAVDCFLGLNLDGLWLQNIYLFRAPV